MQIISEESEGEEEKQYNEFEQKLLEEIKDKENHEGKVEKV